MPPQSYADIQDRIRKIRGLPSRRQGPTDYERALYPLAQEAAQERREKRSRVRPLQAIFDILQRGQYVSANLAQEVIDATRGEQPEVLAAIFEGISGKRKGTFQDVLWGEKGLSPVPQEERKFGHKALGFLADVFLDPTTYLSFGATKAATRAAAEFAEVALKKSLREAPQQIVEALGVRGVDSIEQIAKVAKRLPAQSPAKRWMHDEYNRLFRQGLQLRPEEMATQLGVEAGPTLAKAAYGGAGEGALRFFRRETFKSPVWLRPRQSWEHIKDSLGATETGRRFSDAWWSLTQNPNSPVAALKRAFGLFRSPYEHVLHMRKIEADHAMEAVHFEELGKYEQVVRGLSDEDLAAIRDARARGYTEQRSSADILRERGADEKLLSADENLKLLQRQMYEREQELVSEGLIPEYGQEMEHLTTYVRGRGRIQPRRGGRATGTAEPGPLKPRTFSFEERMGQAERSLRMVFGRAIDDIEPEQLMKLIRDEGLADISTDLGEMFAYRALVHARIMRRASMIRQFQEFGMPVSALTPDTQRLVRERETLGGLQELGLRTSADPALKGYLFDDAVSDVIDRVYNVQRDPGTRDLFMRGIGSFTQWWKGFATFTPRFHLRNFLSNNVTGFLKHGPAWFDPQVYSDAFIATRYALYPGKHIDLLTKELKVPEGFIRGRLATRYGEFSLQEIADQMVELGVVSGRTMGFDVEDVARNIAGKESVSEKVFKPSRYLGNYIENQARVTSFLHDFVDAGGQANSLRYAAQEARRWFIDYTDLTEFERKVMRPLIPFYTWIRHNLANQVAGVMLYHEMYSIIPKGRRALEDQDDFDLELSETWEQEEWAFPVRVAGERMMLQPDIPAADLNMLPFYFEEGEMIPRLAPVRLIREIGRSAHPLVKTIGELVAGRDFFRDTVLRDESGKWDMQIAPELLQYFSKAEERHLKDEGPSLIGFLDGAMRHLGAEDGLGMTVTARGKQVTIDPRAERVLTNNIPAMRTLEDLLRTPQVLAPKLRDWMESRTGQREPISELSELLKTVSFWGGIRLREYDEEYRREKRAAEIRREAEKAYREERRFLPGFQQRSMRAIRQRELSNRRIGIR